MQVTSVYPQIEMHDRHQRWESIMDKVKTIALLALKALVAVTLFITNSTVFCFGFLAGVVFDKQIEQMINKIILIWREQTVKTCIAVGIATFLALPVAWVAGSALYAAYLGCTISRQAQKSWIETHPNQEFSFI